jgi:hypothetical protein
VPTPPPASVGEQEVAERHDPRAVGLRTLSAFTRAMLVKRGRPSREDVGAFLAAGYGERQVLEIVLAIAVKTISNYTNHLFETPVDQPSERRTWTPQKVGGRSSGIDGARRRA